MNVNIIVTKENDYLCGVREYSKLLATKLNQTFINCELIEIKKYDFLNIISLNKKIKKNSVVIIQYPSRSMGYSLAFCFLPWIIKNKNIIIFLHEFTIFSLYRKLLLLINCFYCSFGFTNKIEAIKFQKFFFWKKTNKFIIPLPSNIENKNDKNKEHVKLGVCFFGHIREDTTNIYQFLKIVDEIKKQNPDIKIQIFGSLLLNSNTKKENLIKKFNKLGIDFFDKLSSQQLSKKLQKVKIAILPLKEGASEKKATIFACLNHDITVFTNHTKITPRWLRFLTYQINHMGNKEIAQKALDILNKPDGELSNDHQEMLKNFIKIHSWENVTKIYKNILNNYK